jgi:hypothetical protein
MYTATLSEIRKELKQRSSEEIAEFCLKMARYKKDNKELLNYLLFEAFDEANYIEELKLEIELQFSEIYYAKKSIRRILRFVTTQVRYSGIKQTEVELLIFFCQQFRKLPIPFHQSKVLMNIYDRQLLNIRKAMIQLNEDLQFDYQAELEIIGCPLPM